MHETLIEDGVVREPAALAAEFATRKYAADIVEALNQLEPDSAAKTLALLPPERAIEVLDEPELNDPAGLITRIPEDQAKAVLNGLSADRATDIFQQLPAEDRTGCSPCSRRRIARRSKGCCIIR